jgi:hypothetical protein
MHIGPDVALLAEVGCAGVDAHAHADRSGSQSIARPGSRSARALRRRERDEERVTLRIDLYAPVRGERLTQDASMLGERLRVFRCAEEVQELRGTLDVREQERDRALGKIASHRVMLRRETASVTPPGRHSDRVLGPSVA